MEGLLLWWFTAGLVGVIALARRRSPIRWLVLGIAATPLPALAVLLWLPEGTRFRGRPWNRAVIFALSALIALISVLGYARFIYFQLFRPPGY
jgi:hypothetical protein